MKGYLHPSPVPQLIVDALEGAADPYRLGVITGEQIHQYLWAQTRGLGISPREGKLSGGYFDRGEFLFRTNRSTKVALQRSTPPEPVTPKIAPPGGAPGSAPTALFEGDTDDGVGVVKLNKLVPFVIKDNNGGVACSGDLQIRVVQRYVHSGFQFEYLVRNTDGRDALHQVQLVAEDQSVASGATVTPQGPAARRQTQIFSKFGEPVRFIFSPGVSCATHEWSPMATAFTRRNTAISEAPVRIRVCPGTLLVPA